MGKRPPMRALRRTKVRSGNFLSVWATKHLESVFFKFDNPHLPRAILLADSSTVLASKACATKFKANTPPPPPYFRSKVVHNGDWNRMSAWYLGIRASEHQSISAPLYWVQGTHFISSVLEMVSNIQDVSGARMYCAQLH